MMTSFLEFAKKYVVDYKSKVEWLEVNDKQMI